MSRTADKIFSPRFWLPAFAGAAAALLFASPTARDVVVESLKALIIIVTMPFILEATCALLFICGVLAYNHWRLKKEGDGWVYLVHQESVDETLPHALTERLSNLLLDEKPALVNDADARRSIIEGYLELGMGAQALADFESDATWPDDVATARLRVRVLAANMDTERALSLIKESAARFPDEQKSFVETAVEIARWTRLHTHDPALVERWMREARTLAK